MEASSILILDLNDQGRLKRFETQLQSFVIGRSSGCYLSFPKNDVISREHLRVDVIDRQIWITDLNSSNGTYYKGSKLTPNTACLYTGGSFSLGVEGQGLTVASMNEKEAVVPQAVEIKAPVELTQAIQHTIATTISQPTIEVSKVVEAPIAVQPRIDEILVQMQEIEGELHDLKMKRHDLQLEVDELNQQKREYFALAANFKTYDQLVKIQADYDARTSELEMARLELAQVIPELQSKAALLTAKDSEIDATEAQLKGLSETLRQQQAESTELTAKASGLLALSVSKTAELSSLEAKLATVQTEIKNFEDENGRLSARYDELTNQTAEYDQKLSDLQLRYTERSEEFDRIEKRTKIQLETVDAEIRLKKVVHEREVEEVLTRKSAVMREIDDHQHTINSLKSSVQRLTDERNQFAQDLKTEETRLAALKAEARDLEEKKRLAEVALAALTRKHSQMDEEINTLISEAQKNAHLTVLAAKDEKEQTHLETAKWVEAEMKKLEAEQQAAREAFAATQAQHEADHFKVLENYTTIQAEREAEQVKIVEAFAASQAARELEQAAVVAGYQKVHEELEQNYTARKHQFDADFEEAKRRAMQDHEANMGSLKETFAQKRAQHAEELRLWLSSEEERVKKIAAKNVEGFARQVSMRTLSEFQSSPSVSISALLTTLENKLVQGFTGQAQAEGFFNPNFKKTVQKFWMQAAASAVAVVLLGFGVVYGPSMLGKKLEVMKVANQQSDQRFMQEVKRQREQMLALHLTPREEFQEAYVDNVLYNPGYLSMKLDPEIQKQWTVRLQKFFFDELLFDDRKVVDFMPVEASLVTGLNEIYKIMNSQNFDANLTNMKKLEADKSAEMWLMVGGRDNWNKLRVREKEFYQAIASGHTPVERVPASAK